MSKNKLNKDRFSFWKLKESQYLTIFLVFISIFAFTFLISYLLTNEYITRKSAVSIEEEARETLGNLSTEDLNNLYKNQTQNDQVIILGYHQIRNILPTDTHDERLFITPPEIFAKEMKYLKDNNYTVISIQEYLNYLKNKIQNQIPEKSVVLTFDDGYRTQYSEAFPILKKYNFTGVFFIYEDCINKYPICLTDNEIKEMINSGMKLANHTLHHIYLTKYKDRTIKKEIVENQKLLERFGKENVEKIIAYPYGMVDDRIIKVVKDLGYQAGFGVSVYAKDDNNIYNLPRYLMGENIDNFYDLFNSDK